MRNRKIVFYFISILCVICCICFYIWKEKQTEKYMVLKANMLESDIQNLAVASDVLLEKLRMQVEEDQEYINCLSEKMDALQQEYEFLKLLEQKSNEREGGSPTEVFEKYFQLKQGELARRQGIESSDDCGVEGFLNSHFGGITLNVDEGMYVQYYNSPPLPILEELLPSRIIITSPDVDLGFMDARAGMNFEDIQRNAFETEICEGFFYNEFNKVYYMKYCDNDYEYLFVSGNPNGDGAELIISHIY